MNTIVRRCYECHKPQLLGVFSTSLALRSMAPKIKWLRRIESVTNCQSRTFPPAARIIPDTNGMWMECGKLTAKKMWVWRIWSATGWKYHRNTLENKPLRWEFNPWNILEFTSMGIWWRFMVFWGISLLSYFNPFPKKLKYIKHPIETIWLVVWNIFYFCIYWE